ncbi:hypothetical protein EDC04DRAFT_2600944 [Pisolithus marmoratus]|nr:hypothetical protein EDC04DRAFT_2600944 [Pisolithus marmoratus]
MTMSLTCPPAAVLSAQHFSHHGHSPHQLPDSSSNPVACLNMPPTASVLCGHANVTKKKVVREASGSMKQSSGVCVPSLSVCVFTGNVKQLHVAEVLAQSSQWVTALEDNVSFVVMVWDLGENRNVLMPYSDSVINVSFVSKANCCVRAPMLVVSHWMEGLQNILSKKEKAEKVSQIIAHAHEWEHGLLVIYQTYLHALKHALKGKSLDFCLNTLISIFWNDLTGIPSQEIVKLLNRMIKEWHFKNELNIQALDTKADNGDKLKAFAEVTKDFGVLPGIYM